MKNYKIIPHNFTIIASVIFVLCGGLFLPLIPKENFDVLKQISIALIFFMLSLFFLILSIILGRVKEITQKEFLDGE